MVFWAVFRVLGAENFTRRAIFLFLGYNYKNYTTPLEG
jgi:hypothetical protein